MSFLLRPLSSSFLPPGMIKQNNASPLGLTAISLKIPSAR